MNKQQIINAYVKIRTIDNTIPDEVLDFMKTCAIEKINHPDLSELKYSTKDMDNSYDKGFKDAMVKYRRD